MITGPFLRFRPPTLIMKEKNSARPIVTTGSSSANSRLCCNDFQKMSSSSIRL